MKTIKYVQIGAIHSPFKEPKGTPIQSIVAQGIEGTGEVFQDYSEELMDIDGFSHVILVYYFHLSNR